MARGELKTIKFQMMLSETEAKTLDEWAERHGFKSRAEVIRRLCQLALLTDERALSIAKNLNTVDNLAVRFANRVKSAKSSFSRSKNRLTERLAEFAELYSEELFDHVGDLSMDLDLILRTTGGLRQAKSLDEVTEQLRQDRLRLQETTESLTAARQKRREEKKRLEGVDFVDLQNRMESVIRSSQDLDLAQEAAHQEISLWLEGAKTNKAEIEKRERERDIILAERRKLMEQPQRAEEDPEDQTGA
ncbi:hypothetical protein [Sinorhizobium saheli]|uniref:Uncharacterized protein n=1 Tax=Sinorhizobium saheli TaxID=36856 RepID=A0A178XXR3_SINSA|nr:hypothetical protein [Sinorhizobium saheli]MQW88555.1 hypothetical protein [Sinorhizobium saheli]OAP39275.1 hypothetical protein ATB98_02990 [Sinorhizobium saheli]